MNARSPDSAAHGLRTIRLDLHVHTVVSPCAEVEMIPPLIVKRAHDLGLDLIAITDHNTAENVEAVQVAARGTGIVVMPGIEVQTREEVHLLCLFDTLDQICAWQAMVYNSLPSLANRPDVFGAQFVVDATGDFLRENERLLLTSVAMSTEETVAAVREIGGLPIAAHVDRPSYSLLGSLGFVPEGLALGGLEISRRQTAQGFRGKYPSLAHWPLIGSSDAHQLADMAVRSVASVRAMTVVELELALQGREGRSVTIID
jgi:3',5'-nucleoside bisphosphate phosphatase